MRVLMAICDVCLRFFAAWLLTYSAIVHLSNPYLFFGSVLSYDLIGVNSSVFIAALLPSVNLIVGVALLIMPFRAIARNVATVLFVLYSFVQWSALSQGLQISCGCFGDGTRLVTTSSATAVSVLAVLLAISCVISAQTKK